MLDRLWYVVMNRRDADPTISHSARLLSRGPAKVAQKFGEEAVECLIEAVRGDRDAVIAESADVLYHLIVVWVSTGVAPEEVWAELMRREGVSGIAEKASRAQTSLVARVLKTTKIPSTREPEFGRCTMPVSGLPPYDDANIFARILRGEIPSKKVYRGRVGVRVPRHQPAGAGACADHSEGQILLVRGFQCAGK